MACYAPIDIPASGKEPFTDYARWRLRSSEDGRHTWHYLQTDEECKAWPQTEIDRYWLGLPVDLPALPPPEDALDAARNGFKFYKHLQDADGHWAGEYGGPMFLLPGLVIGSYVSGMTFTQEERLEIIRYLINLAHPKDGGWGLHIEGQSTAFGTALNYCVMRILGVSPEHPTLVKARATLHKLGGATGVPSWGKFWLSVLNVYDWEGNNSILPELWLFPDLTPFHPHKWWIHTRTVYIPMSYLYSLRWKMEENDLILALREELYPQNYYSIDWPAQRNNICHVDLYAPHTALFDFLYSILNTYEPCAAPPLRKLAMERCYQLVVQEDENTGYQTLGPVSKMINLIIRTIVDGKESEAYKLHMEKRADFLWIGKEGMRMCGTNGSQLWDIAFIAQALVETGLGDESENQESLVRALRWLDQCQIQQNPKHFESSYRHPTKGAWPFSTKTQGYTVSDCTGEGLKAVLYIQEHVESTPKLVSERRMCDSVDLLLGMQNADGGFASYELIRGPEWLEKLNPAEVFGAIMIEHSYPECTTSVITALSIFRKYYPKYRSADIETVIKRAVKYLHNAQTPEGGWVGSWGICFTYAAQFACESLALVGETYDNSPYLRKACEFLLSHQRADGGWGESYKSCETSSWVEHEQTQVVQTSWATMALIYARYPKPEPIERAVHLVMSRQNPDGSWSQEAMEGIFNKSVTIAYPNFKFSFTIWMLGRAHHYLAELKARRNGHQIGKAGL
ncbi:terpene synthase [Rhodofomes roseus]|uniref:Terpene cyclase/mutase family member n=1 Tax=Rhodofomes roseus TaxID=34475 RepID=A0ABQ8KP96_9APHY|nr:terpene synthase [Rhodofomes roseus]KAH9840136.1 terpene synthase [Rhodofomes roseus]